MRTPPNERVSSDIADKGSSRTVGSERRCVLTGETSPRDTLVRLALGPEGTVLPDPLAKAPGRGAWIGVTRPELEAAMANGKLKGALSRAFKTGDLTIPAELPELVETGLTKTLLDRLGLEKRAGTLILGTDRIAQSARMGEIAWLGHAADASEDGCKKLDQAWRVGRDAEGSGEQGTRLPLDRTALSVALGRDNVVHLGLLGTGTGTGAAERVMQILNRLLHFQGALPEGQDAGPDARAASAMERIEGSTS